MTAEKQRLTVLNRLSAEYPSFVSLEEMRQDTLLFEVEFQRVVAYLQEKAYIELRDIKHGESDVFGEARITAAGMDYIEAKSRQVRASIIR
jgi:hypothetical protein